MPKNKAARSKKVLSRLHTEVLSQRGEKTVAEEEDTSLYTCLSFPMMNALPYDVALRCDSGGGVLTHSQILMLTSSFFNTAIAIDKQEKSNNETGCKHTCLKVDSAPELWKVLLGNIYPMGGGLSLGDMMKILPLVHKYDFACLLQSIMTALKAQLPNKLGLIDHLDSLSVFKWLQLAETLQLDDLADICHNFLSATAFSSDMCMRQKLRKVILGNPPFLLKIEGFSLECGLNTSSSSFNQKSAQFEAISENWYLSCSMTRAAEEGSEGGTRNYLALYLYRAKSSTLDKKASFSISVINQKNGQRVTNGPSVRSFLNNNELGNATGCSWGWANFMTFEKLQETGWVEGKCLRVSVSISECQSTSTDGLVAELSQASKQGDDLQVSHETFKDLRSDTRAKVMEALLLYQDI